MLDGVEMDAAEAQRLENERLGAHKANEANDANEEPANEEVERKAPLEVSGVCR